MKYKPWTFFKNAKEDGVWNAVKEDVKNTSLVKVAEKLMVDKEGESKLVSAIKTSSLSVLVLGFIVAPVVALCGMQEFMYYARNVNEKGLWSKRVKIEMPLYIYDEEKHYSHSVREVDAFYTEDPEKCTLTFYPGYGSIDITDEGCNGNDISVKTSSNSICATAYFGENSMKMRAHGLPGVTIHFGENPHIEQRGCSLEEANKDNEDLDLILRTAAGNEAYVKDNADQIMAKGQTAVVKQRTWHEWIN